MANQRQRLSHYEKWVSKRALMNKEPRIYRCPHCDFSGDLDAVWWHIDQHPYRPRHAQGTEAQRAETENTGSVHDGPVGNADASNLYPSKEGKND